MDKMIDSAKKGLSPEDKEFIRLQLSQSIETFRTQFNLMVQILTVFVIADVTLIGYAVSSKISGIILLAGSVPLFMIYVSRQANNFMMPVLYTAIIIETKYGEKDGDWLASTFMAAIVTPELVKRCQEISQLESFEDRISTIRKQNLEFAARVKLRVVLSIIAIMHVISAIIISMIFKWTFI